MSTPIILDCDPGIDDALAITFATASPEIDLVGLTTVAGNVGLPKTTANALAVASFVGAKNVPVTPGSAVPLLRPALDAGHVHGDSGLGGAVLPAPARTAEDGHAIDFIIDTIGAAPGEITLVATGPLTNIGLALRREPRLATWVRDFVIMGGSASRGNVNHAAEYNIWADPEAAAIVFSAGWTVRMIGLDVTLRARATAAVQERMRAYTAQTGQAAPPTTTPQKQLVGYVSLYSEGQLAFSSKILAVAPQANTRLGVTPFVFTLPLGALKVANYECQITLLDAEQHRVAFWQGPLRVVP